MFGQQIKSLRKQNKMSQAELARQLEVTQQAIGKWETGKSTPDSATLSRIAEIFKTSVDFLLGRDTPSVSDSFPFQVEYEEEGYGIPVIGTVRAGYNSLAYNDD